MESDVPLKSQFRVALLSSTAIGFITLAPVYVTVMYVTEQLAPQTVSSILKLSPFSPLMLVILGTLFISMLIFMFWTIIILYAHFIEKRHIRIAGKMKYLTSYLICVVAFIGLRNCLGLLAHLFFHSLESEKASFIASFNAHSIETMRIILIALFTLSAVTIIFIIQNILILRQKEAVIESENAQLKIKNIEATYQQLKQQINPHFLFNSLNALKTLIRRQPANAEKYLKSLSDFLRTSITLDKKNVVKLEDELKFCMNYLDLQKVRFGKALEFNVNIPPAAMSGFLPVFSLQQLLENAIKHNALTDDSPLVLNISYENDRIIVSNNIREKDITQESTGMGLSNLTERYKILSGDEVIINTDSGHFSVSLKVLENENSNYRG